MWRFISVNPFSSQYPLRFSSSKMYYRLFTKLYWNKGPILLTVPIIPKWSPVKVLSKIILT